FSFQAEDGIRDFHVTGVQTCALPIYPSALLVLLTGIGMLLQVGMLGKTKPFWLAFMEQFGGMVALISAGLLTWQLRRLDRSATRSAERRVGKERRSRRATR